MVIIQVVRRRQIRSRWGPPNFPSFPGTSCRGCRAAFGSGPRPAELFKEERPVMSGAYEVEFGRPNGGLFGRGAGPAHSLRCEGTVQKEASDTLIVFWWRRAWPVPCFDIDLRRVPSPGSAVSWERSAKLRYGPGELCSRRSRITRRPSSACCLRRLNMADHSEGY